MSVRSVTFRGKPCWLVDVCRSADGIRRRRYLDKARYRKRDALLVESELVVELERPDRTSSARDRTVSAAEVARAAPRGMPTLAEFAAEFLDLADQSRPGFKNKVRALHLHIFPALGSIPLDAIDTRAIDHLRARLRTPDEKRAASSRRSRGRTEPAVTARRKGGARSPKTVNNILGVLRAVLNRAHEYNLIDRVPKIHYEREARRDPEFLDFDEANAVIGAIADRWRALLHFAIRTGLRRGELMALRWSDVHIGDKRSFVRVRRSLRRGDDRVWVVKDPKGNRPRSVPLCSDIVAALRHHRCDARDDDLVFPGNEGQYFDDGAYYRELTRAAKAAGLHKHVHPHMTRHTFASHATMRGVPAEKIRQWMGHANLSTTERYAHLRPEFGDEMIERLVS